MNERWTLFKKLPTSVKIKLIIAFIPSLILYEIFTLGKVANQLNRIMISWIYRED